VQPFTKINLSLPKQEIFRGDSSEIIKILFNKLNANLKITILPRDVYSLGSIGPNGTYDGLIAALSDSKVDITMNARSLFILWKVRYVSIFLKNKE